MSPSSNRLFGRSTPSSISRPGTGFQQTLNPTDASKRATSAKQQTGLKPFIRPLTKRLNQWRRPAIFWAATVLVAFICAQIISAAAQPMPSEWGESRLVAVASRELVAGTVLTRTDLAIRSVPTAFLPAHPATSIEKAAGRRLTKPLRSAAPIDLQASAPQSITAISAQIGRGRSGVAIEANLVPQSAAVGDNVTIRVNGEGDGRQLLVVKDSVVTAIGDREVLMAIDSDDADSLAAARVVGTVSVSIQGG